MKRVAIWVLLISSLLLFVPVQNVIAVDATNIVQPNQSVTASSPTSSADGLTSTERAQQLQAQREQIAAQRAALKAQKKALGGQRCDNIEQKIQLNQNRYNNNLVAWTNVFQKFSGRISLLIQKFDTAGYDTTKLKADLVVLNTKLDKFKTDKAAALALLQETKQYACGKSEGEFRVKLQATRIAINTARFSALEFRSYYLTTIRPDIMALKNQARTGTPINPGDSSVTSTDTTVPQGSR